MYGKDAGRNEGRRNQIESRQYVEVKSWKISRKVFDLFLFCFSDVFSSVLSSFPWIIKSFWLSFSLWSSPPTISTSYNTLFYFLSYPSPSVLSLFANPSISLCHCPSFVLLSLLFSFPLSLSLLLSLSLTHTHTHTFSLSLSLSLFLSFSVSLSLSPCLSISIFLSLSSSLSFSPSLSPSLSLSLSLGGWQ